MTSYHVSLLRENTFKEISSMHYYVIVDVEGADTASQMALSQARAAYPDDQVQLIAVKRNVKRLRPPAAPGRSFLMRPPNACQEREMRLLGF